MANADDIAARLMQMRINTRLTALQSAQTLIATPGYSAKFLGDTDHRALLTIARAIEDYVIGDLEKEAEKAIEAAKNPRPNIIKVRQ